MRVSTTKNKTTRTIVQFMLLRKFFYRSKKGKNLLDKLILEDRIHIKDIELNKRENWFDYMG
ncbi:hypothetical protein OENI_20227 [Oenococcus oeni]|nr:hypothetical protein OENI_20227 [Oenococcus oeni]